ncbi:MAG: Patatin [Gammaproteobacteria bacterium]|nr:Patatin [Gammaproteobacteria bacterium]
MKKKVGLVLPGGGARGAYQVGVLKAFLEISKTKSKSPFDIYSGTSAGAINGAFLASQAHIFDHSVVSLVDVWSNFTTNKVYKTDPITMFKSSVHWFLTIVSGGVLMPNPASLLDNQPLRILLRKRIKFPDIQNNVESSIIESLAVTSASYRSRKSCTFFQANSNVNNWRKTHREGKKTTINLDHLMASVALPLIFPAVRIKDEYFGDGAMRQATPLSPAIRLGAEKLMIISAKETDDRFQFNNPREQYPSFAKITGYMLEALFLDGLYSDIERLNRINQIIKNSGDREIRTNNKTMKYVDYLVISPSEDLNEIAQKHYHNMPLSIRLLLQGLGLLKDRKSELLSFLLFESAYTNELIDLGYRDGIGKKEEIADFMNR